jgi:hypothetical protein
VKKKITDVIDRYGPQIQMEKKRLQKIYNSSMAVESELEHLTEQPCQLLFNNSINELSRLSTKLSAQRNEITTSILSAREKGEKPEADLLEREELLDIQIRILERTIHNKRSYQKKFADHPVERNIIEHALFSSTTPNEKTLQKLRTNEGIIEFDKHGFKKLYYRNENGNFLTPYDSKVFIGLFKMWEMKGKSRVFEFEYKELLKEIFTDLNGGEYVKVEESLDNLAKTSIVMEEYLNPNSKRRSRTRIHNPIQNADIQTTKATIEFNNYLHESLLGGNYIRVNMSLFNDLANPTSKNLYVLIVNSIKENILHFDIDALIPHLDLHSSTRTKAVNCIKDAFQELKLFDVITDAEFPKVGNKQEKVYFQPSDWLKQMSERLEESPPLSVFISNN